MTDSNRGLPDSASPAPDPDPEPLQFMSARATGKNGKALTPEEIEAAEEEAMAWARRVNTC